MEKQEFVLNDNDGAPSKECIKNALNRVMTIYKNEIKSSGMLVWKVYPQDIQVDSNTTKITEFYWDLKKVTISMEKVFLEIILGDLGGVQEFFSSVYLFDIENHVMLHLYDDIGLDVVAYDKDTLISLYKKLNIWILDYDCEYIDEIFFH